MVPSQRQHGRGGRTALTEHRDVRMAEAVDRLELVADDEEISVRHGIEKVEQLRLETVRVLELVDHDRAKALPFELADLRVAAEKVAGAELKVLEVERGLALLGRRVCRRKRREELLQELSIARRELFERRRDDPVAS